MITNPEFIFCQECKQQMPETVGLLKQEAAAIRARIAELETALSAEMKNRCCGNCLYMDTIFEITGERQCEVTKRSADRESDPCEHWRSCRG